MAGRQAPQDVHLAALMRPHGDAIRDGVAQQLVQRASFYGQTAVLGITFQQPLAFKETSAALSDGVCQLSQLSTRRRLHPAKSRARPIRAIGVDTIEKEQLTWGISSWDSRNCQTVAASHADPGLPFLARSIAFL